MKTDSRKKSDVIVIGGGVIGTAITYHLAKKKVGVTLVEQGDLAAGSSGACDGLVFLQSKKPGIHLSLALASKGIFENLEKELPTPIEYRPCGGLVLIETPEEFDIMTQYVRDQQGIGLDVSLLGTDEMLKLEPHLSPTLSGATYSPMDGQVNPIALTHALALGAKALGVKILTHTRVTGLRWRRDKNGKEIKEGRVEGVETDKGGISADVVVNAAGVLAPMVGRFAGLNIPIVPRRGQILVTSAAKPMIRTCMISAKYIAAKYRPAAADSGGYGISMEQTESGTLLLGSTREFVGFDKRTTLKEMAGIANQTRALLPGLSRLQIIRSFAGLRPYTPDGLPLLGYVPGIDNLVLACGHEGDGIALSPITGKLIAQLVVEGRAEMPMEAFRPDRFE